MATEATVTTKGDVSSHTARHERPEAKAYAHDV